jgi:hypothetical protein
MMSADEKRTALLHEIEAWREAWAASETESPQHRDFQNAPSIIRGAADWIDRINAAVPHSLARDQRQDIISDMAEAVLAGRLPVTAIEARAGEFVRARFRADHNRWGDVSLDLPIVGTTLRLGDTVTRGLWG